MSGTVLGTGDTKISYHSIQWKKQISKQSKKTYVTVGPDGHGDKWHLKSAWMENRGSGVEKLEKMLREDELQK